MKGSTYIHIKKERIKFSSAHATIFPDGTKEGLHGHNYLPELSVELDDVFLTFDVLKKAMEKVCNLWDERTLMPSKSQYLKILNQTAESVEFLLCNKRYVLPKDEVVFLPVDNVTSESLAQVFLKEWLEALGEYSEYIRAASVRIEETPGQGASFLWEAP